MYCNETWWQSIHLITELLITGTFYLQIVFIVKLLLILLIVNAADTSTNWRQSRFCCCTASMEQATDGAETAAIDGLVSSWSENISVSFCLRAPGYGLTLWLALGLLVGGAIQVPQLRLQLGSISRLHWNRELYSLEVSRYHSRQYTAKACAYLRQRCLWHCWLRWIQTRAVASIRYRSTSDVYKTIAVLPSTIGGDVLFWVDLASPFWGQMGPMNILWGAAERVRVFPEIISFGWKIVNFEAV